MEQNESIRTKDGRQMEITLFLPSNQNSCVLLVGQDVTMKTSEYTPMAKYMAGKGYVVMIFSYRGLNGSGVINLAGEGATMKHWAMQDLNGALLYAKKQFPKSELIFLGHGMSGEIAGLAPAIGYVNRMILVNSALTCSRLRPFHIRISLFLLKAVAPLLMFLFGYFPGKRIGYLTDLPKGVFKEWAGWCNNGDGLFDEFPDNNYCRLTIPLLAISFTGNPFIPPGAVAALLSRYSHSHIKWLHLSPHVIKQLKCDGNSFFQSRSAVDLWDMMDNWLQSDAAYNGYFNQQDKISFPDKS